MRDLVKEEVPIEATAENIKMALETFAKTLYSKPKSTTELKKTGQIEIVYDAFNKILIERTNGENLLAPFSQS